MIFFSGCIGTEMPQMVTDDLILEENEYELLDSKVNHSFPITIGFEIKYDNDENNSLIDLEESDGRRIHYYTPWNYDYGVNVYTLTSDNYSNFVNCGEFSPIEELSWENAIEGEATQNVSSMVGQTDRIYIVIDNHHCDSSGAIEPVRVEVAVVWEISSVQEFPK